MYEHIDGSCEAVLVRGVNWIGDAVMTIPALRALRRSLPEARVSLLVKPWVSPLFEKDPDIDEIINYSEDFRGISGKLRLSRELRNRNFCMSVLFQNAFDAALLAFLAGIPERIGYSRDGRRFLLTQPIDFDERAKSLHHIQYYLELVKKTGITPKAEAPWIFLDLEERLCARAVLGGLKRPVIAINPGATYGSSKKWLPERFAEVAALVMHEIGGSVLLLGGPKETGIADEILQNVRNVGDTSHMGSASLLSLSGKTSLRELIAIIAESDVLLTNDSGPMHIGYAVGTPVVAIFGSTSPEHTGPVGATDIVIRRPVACSPCFERECRKKSLECMDLITTAEVFAAVKRSGRTKRAVFFDRDGTLCRDAHYLSRMDDLELFPSIACLRALKDRGLALIGVTNQSGIARGLVQEEFTQKVNRIFVERYGFDDFYYCPHHPDEHCLCRKPEPGMLIRARNEHFVDLRQSFVVGDKEEDMVLARAAGAQGILVTTGKVQASVHADAVADGLENAVSIILSMTQRKGHAS
jgi:heptosyltransferase-2